jgi:hypothetical protein
MDEQKALVFISGVKIRDYQKETEPKSGVS